MNKVYYDDKCIVCHSGITYLKKKHPKSDIEFFEISRLDDPIHYSKAIIGEFETNKFKGFDTIIILLRKLGYKKLSVIIGIPVGILLGLIYFVRMSIAFPFQMFETSVDKWERRVQIEQADIWTRHVARMQEKQDRN